MSYVVLAGIVVIVTVGLMALRRPLRGYGDGRLLGVTWGSLFFWALLTAMSILANATTLAFSLLQSGLFIVFMAGVGFICEAAFYALSHSGARASASGRKRLTHSANSAK